MEDRGQARAVEQRRRAGQRLRLENAAQREMLADRARGKRLGDPMRTLVLFDEAAFLQPAEHVAHDRPADPEMDGEFGFDQAIAAKDETGGDVAFDRLIDALPRGAALQRVVDRLGNAQADLQEIEPQRLEDLAGIGHHEAAAAEAPHDALRLQAPQRRLHRRPARLHQPCDRPLDQHQAARH